MHKIHVFQDEADLSDLPCFFNREVSRNVGVHGYRKMECLKSGAEVYLPFTFMRNQFEIFGSYVENNGIEVIIVITDVQP